MRAPKTKRANAANEHPAYSSTTTVAIDRSELLRRWSICSRRPPMTDPIDYSRPVGWWCPVCTRVSMGDYLLQAIRLNRRCLDTDEARQRRLHMVPVYLPIPEGQRPPSASEVEEAEVVTLTFNERCWIASNETTLNVTGGADVVAGTALDTLQYCIESFQSYYVAEINRIAQASARARIVTGATE